VTAPVVDVLLVSAWGTIAAVDLHAARANAAARRALGPALVGGRRPPAALLIVLVVATLAGLAVIERSTGRLVSPPWLVGLGLALAAAGVALHVRARHTLGASWSGVVTVRAGQTVIDRGPYAVVRHPLYASLLLLAGGTLLAHPSAGTSCVALGFGFGLALKIRIEEHALRRVLGPAWDAYAARVPALLPRLRRRGIGTRSRHPGGTECPSE